MYALVSAAAIWIKLRGAANSGSDSSRFVESLRVARCRGTASVRVGWSFAEGTHRMRDEALLTNALLREVAASVDARETVPGEPQGPRWHGRERV